MPVGRLQVLSGLHLCNALAALDVQGHGIEFPGLIPLILDIADHPEAHIRPDPDAGIMVGCVIQGSPETDLCLPNSWSWRGLS